MHAARDYSPKVRSRLLHVASAALSVMSASARDRGGGERQRRGRIGEDRSRTRGTREEARDSRPRVRRDRRLPSRRRARSKLPLVGRALDLVRGPVHARSPQTAPATLFLARAAFTVLGQSEPLAVRLPSAVCGTLAIAVAFLVGRRLSGPRAGLFAAFFFSPSLRSESRTHGKVDPTGCSSSRAVSSCSRGSTPVRAPAGLVGWRTPACWR